MTLNVNILHHTSQSLDIFCQSLNSLLRLYTVAMWQSNLMNVAIFQFCWLVKFFGDSPICNVTRNCCISDKHVFPRGIFFYRSQNGSSCEPDGVDGSGRGAGASLQLWNVPVISFITPAHRVDLNMTKGQYDGHLNKHLLFQKQEAIL